MLDDAVGSWGFAGLKLYPPCGFTPSDPELDPFYEVCSAARVPVLTHIGPTSSWLSFRHARPEHVDDALREQAGIGPEGDLGDDDDLLAQGILDSMGGFRLLVFLGEQYGIEILELQPGDIASVSAIVRFVRRQLQREG